jgi:hypothetical protein
MITTVDSLSVIYTAEGDLFIAEPGTDVTDAIGHFDADGGEWVAAIDGLLVVGGYERTGEWIDSALSSDECSATVRRLA